MRHLAILILSASLLPAQTARHITTPKEALGFNVGDDYHVANYTQLEAYWKKVAAESDRVKLVDIGQTAEGRHQWMAIVSAPENLKNLAHYQQISQRLAHAEGLTEENARALSREGKAVVWVDGGLHATETVGSQQLIEMVYQMASRTDAETMRLLADDILLCVAANPDGQELVANWYMREPDPARRSLNNLPRLYQKYIGHDNNRDSLTSNMAETTNMNRQLFTEWIPQIMYNHHQSGPAGEVIFIPPFRDPVNHNVDSLVTLGIQAVGTAMHSRLVAQGKGGSGMRTQAPYDGWWNGGMRNTATFHNTIAILTEIIGNPTPMEIPLIPEKQVNISDLPLPIAPRTWHYRESIDYSMETNRAILDYAARNRETLLFNMWRMGMNSVERGNRDTWTITPKRVDALREAAGSASGAVSAGLYEKVLHDPALRDARGYIMPAGQADFPTVTRFVNSLIKSGITVVQANAAFAVAGKTYPAGSYVVKSAQAFRPMVRDMFEPQDHPHDAQFPGGPPIAPYDIAGWTLAMQMGVQYDRVLTAFDGPFTRLTGLQQPSGGGVTGPANPAGYLISHQVNNGFILVNRLLKANAETRWLKAPVPGYSAGAIWVPASPQATAVISASAKALGIAVQSVAAAPAVESISIRPLRIGLYDQYGGLMPSGWTRWLFEQFEFPFEVIYPETLDAGNLKNRMDVLVLTDGAFRSGAGGRGGGRGGAQIDPASIPAEYRARLGRITEEKTIPQLRQFVESGGSVVTIGSSTAVAELLGVAAGNAVRGLSRDKFYIPGSLMCAKIDNTQPVAYGMPDEVDLFYDNSPVFKLAAGSTRVAWFEGQRTLTSGWALGQPYLDGMTAVVEARLGEGRVYAMGPEVAFRGEPHATFKLLFNAVLLGAGK